MPDLFIITGSNGAGKSSLGPDYLPKHITENHAVFDGDLLYTRKLRELFPSQTKSVKYAKKDALAYVQDLFERQTASALENNENYVYEGHFINDETWKTPEKFKSAGFINHLIFLGLENPYQSELRVAERTASGGHYVEPQTIENNFYGNLQKLNIYHHLIDELTIIDASTIEHRPLFIKDNNTIIYHVPKQELPEWFTTDLASLAKLIE